MRVRDALGGVLLSGISGIDSELDLRAYDGRQIDLFFDMTNSAGQSSTEAAVPVNVDSSPHLRKVAQVPGLIWDADAGRILYCSLAPFASAQCGGFFNFTTANLFIRDRATGSNTQIHSGTRNLQYGFLTAAGVAFAEHQSGFPNVAGKSWESGVLVDLGGLHSNESLRGKGKYLSWSNGSNPWQVFRRDVTSGSTVTVHSNALGVGNDVAANGAVSFLDLDRHVFQYRPDGGTAQLTFGTTQSCEGTRTDGDAVVYDTGCSSERLLAYNKDGIEQVLATGGGQRPGEGFQISNGWVAYMKSGEAWRMDSRRMQSQVSFLNGNTWLDKLDSDGTLLIFSLLPPAFTANRRYLAGTLGGPVRVSSSLGRSFFIGGRPHLAIGNTLFAIQFSESSFNGDVRSDLMWRNSATGQVYRMLMGGIAISGEAMVYVEPNTAWKIVADGDFNGDGVADPLWRHDSTGQVFLMIFGANGFPADGSFIYTEANPAWKIVSTPDLDGDGRADLVWWNSTTGQVWAMLIDGFTIKAQAMVYHEPSTAWRIVGAGDFFGFGAKNGLLWHNIVTGQVFLMHVAVSGTHFAIGGGMLLQESDTSWKILGAADFNGDGKSDILWRKESTGQVSVMLMNSDVVASVEIVYQEPNLAWKIVAQGDYNGDGKADLLWRNDTTGQVYMMLMNGTAIASQGMVYQEPNTAWRLQGPWEYSQ